MLLAFYDRIFTLSVNIIRTFNVMKMLINFWKFDFILDIITNSISIVYAIDYFLLILC